jgi:hypothetical protein
MNLQNIEILRGSEFTDIVRAIFDGPDHPSLTFLKRTSLVQAESDELTIPTPKIKNGLRVGTAVMRRILNGQDEELLKGWRANISEQIVSGIQQRMNVMLCEQALDTPLERTAPEPWGSDLASPVTDIRNFVVQVKNENEEQFDRVTLSTSALKLAFLTRQFQNLKASYLSLFDLDDEHTFSQDVHIFTSLVKIQVEIDDTTYFQIEADGKKVQHRVLPAFTLIFSNTSQDKKKDVADFAVGRAVESMFPELKEPEFGPIAYVTVKDKSDEQIDGEVKRELELSKSISPDITEAELNAIEQSIREVRQDAVVWAVLVGQPRKHLQTYTATLKVG